jgi:hypothetical protein
MDCLTFPRCTICGNYKEHGKAWFHITETHWEDKLMIWRWNAPMATRASVHSLCCPRHVREWVVHWMTTGCLHYPFASGNPRCLRTAPRTSQWERNRDPDLVPYQVGEIAVDRESIARALRENSTSLNVILEELMNALEDPRNGPGTEVEDDPYTLFA